MWALESWKLKASCNGEDIGKYELHAAVFRFDLLPLDMSQELESSEPILRWRKRFLKMTKQADKTDLD